MSLYDDMRAVAGDVLAQFSQGTVRYVSMAQATGATPDAPDDAVPTSTVVNTTVSPVSTKYVDGSNIVQSDLQITLANDGVVPEMTGSFEIDGVRYKIINVLRRPSAGTPISFTVIVRR